MFKSVLIHPEVKTGKVPLLIDTEFGSGKTIITDFLRQNVDNYLILDLFFFDMPITIGMRIKI